MTSERIEPPFICPECGARLLTGVRRCACGWANEPPSDSHPHRGPAAWTCAVCGQGINRFEDPHTYHAEGCPLRDPAPHTYPSADDCTRLTGCGEDVHESCCPTCTGQAL